MTRAKEQTAKLAFNVTLELSFPEGYVLTAGDVEAYRAAFENALEQQAGFGGLTPDFLSDEGVGVEWLNVEKEENVKRQVENKV